MEIYFRKHNVWSQTFAQYSHVTRWINRREIWFVYSIISWWKRWDKLEWWECVIFDAVLFADASLSATTQFNSSSAIKPLSYRWWRMRQENRGMQKEACTHIMKVSERKRMIEITLNFIWLHFGDVLRSTSKKKRALPFSITSTNKSHTHTQHSVELFFTFVSRLFSLLHLDMFGISFFRTLVDSWSIAEWKDVQVFLRVIYLFRLDSVFGRYLHWGLMMDWRILMYKFRVFFFIFLLHFHGSVCVSSNSFCI